MPKSKIEWTEHTWNPVTGCTKISEGCRNCYAENMAKRFGGEDAFKVALHPEKLDIPLNRKKPTTYFVCSMSDLFHDDVPFEFIDHIWAIMALTPHHTYQVLTKRPERMYNYFERHFTRHKIGSIAVKYTKKFHPDGHGCDPDICNGVSPLNNVWLGVTAENQKEANQRVPILLSTPAALRFVSIEPMLEKINLEMLLDSKSNDRFRTVYSALCGKKTLWDTINLLAEEQTEKIDWVIGGGESGQKARPLNPLWVKDLQEQCTQANVPFFFKQWGEFSNYEEDGFIHMDRVGKKQAGYLIDGMEYREMPRIQK